MPSGFFGQNLQKKVWNKKTMSISKEFYIFEIVKVPNFRLNQQFWIFGLNQPKKGVSNLKKKKN